MNNHGVQIGQGPRGGFRIGGERATRYNSSGMRVIYKSKSYMAKIGSVNDYMGYTPLSSAELAFGVKQVEREISVWKAASSWRRGWLARMVGWGRAEFNLHNGEGLRVYLFNVMERVVPKQGIPSIELEDIATEHAEKLGVGDMHGNNWLVRKRDNKPVIVDYGL